MTITASQNYMRTSVQKLKFVADSVKGMDLLTMRTHLSYLNKDAARRLLQVVDQALANASHNHGLSADQLQIESLLILRGPHYKRMRAVSRGQGHAILKRTSHVVLKLKSVEKTEQKIESKAAEKQTVAVEAKPEVKKTVKKTVAKKTTKKEVAK
ncbi:50S ribosomal protein L22 [Candidatus Cerribacteria bacterium 'Amazon FNV 2010 28 9']|uniref:50S ribosomal protein L22 n=1 Tax=Candidatus Cerribacteria bacterium 'Amazon FNV 2010 28 9' TaxID=2081795 RepID=A0A317JTA5_9BACT|nr:MAG: 50S ribosomal protein L22 [Candidatus Cerribacteria bacterium 'Amazon FNV 2010 28 9']